MDFQIQMMIDKFLRRCCEKFSAKAMTKFFSQLGVRIPVREAESYLLQNPLVFPLENNLFVTRAGVFTGELFSIKPSPSEFEQKVLVPGSRCIPFVDGELLSSDLTFLDSKGNKLQHKVGTFDSDAAIDMYIVYGEEYAPQYIASDPANSSLNMVQREFELPNTVKLTGIDISPFIEEGMQKGDRFLCTVADWDSGVIKISAVHDGENIFNMGQEGSLRLKWYKTLEEGLLESFNSDGPCSSMEEQLSNLFCRKLDELCIPLCGSIEEYLNQYARNVAIEQFGVESRLWKKGESVPAVGLWNKNEIDELGKKRGQPNKDYLSFSIPSPILEQYIINMHFERDIDFNKLIENIYPQNYSFQKGEKEYIMLKLKEKDVIVSKEYNWFADQTCGIVRKKALELFTRINEMVFTIDSSSTSMAKFPQQELVTLTQLYTHIVRILQSVSENDHIEEDKDALLLSLDGMEWNFEDIEESLKSAVEEQQLSKFKIIK